MSFPLSSRTGWQCPVLAATNKFSLGLSEQYLFFVSMIRLQTRFYSQAALSLRKSKNLCCLNTKAGC